MRIRRIQLVGLAAALAGGAASNALANPLVITASHAPVNTSTANSGAGDVTINAGGSIPLTTAGTSGITVDSSNNATVSAGGTINSNNLNDVNGIHILTGNTANISNAGTISLLEDHTLSDTDSDGDLDGEFADPASTHRYGILLDAGTLTGNITNAGTINVEGNNSAGIRLLGFLNGNGTTTGLLETTSTGQITVTGENSVGILIDAGIAGSANLRGSVTMLGQNSPGLLVNGDIGGALNISGNWLATGYLSTFPPTDQTHMEAGDLEQGGSAIAIHADVVSGITIEGIGVEDDPDDDHDTLTGTADTNDNASGSVRTLGSAPAVDISATLGSIVIGGTSNGYGLRNRGTIQGDGLYNNIDGFGLRITGVGANTVTTGLGLNNDGFIGASASEANATAILIGQNATVPTILNRKGVTTLVTSESAADTAYGIYLETGANVTSLINDGTMTATLQGEDGDAVVIYDNDTNSLTSILNTGSIKALIVATGGETITSNADAIAIDLHNSMVNVTITQQADTTHFTDDDTVDDDVNVRPPVLIEGDIRLGGGNDQINLLTGSITGDISFGNGSDDFVINNGASFVGQIDDADSDLDITVTDGLMNLRGGNAEISSAFFDSDSELRVLLTGDSLDPPVLESSGAIHFATDSVLTINVPSGLPENDTQIFLVANGGLTIDAGAHVLGPITGTGTPFLYDLSVALTNPLALNGAPNGLEATYQIKTPTALGLSQNEGNAFQAIIDALRTQTTAGDAVLAIDNQSDFLRAYSQLMPNYSSGATELATTAIQQMQSATSNRLASTRLHGLHDVSAWGQEIGYGLTRTPATINGAEFRGSGFGFAAGIDGPLDNGALFGLSASFLASEVEEPQRSDGEISTAFGQVNAYLGTAVGVFDLDFVGGLGGGKMKSRRFVNIDNTFSAIAEADWWAYEVHGAARASMPLSMGDWLTITPQAQLTYVGLNEEGYSEDGGGTAINYDVDSAFSQRLWGDVGVEFAARWEMRGQSVVSPRLYLGYRANVLDDQTERTYRFVSGGPDFNLTDESVGDGAPLVGLGIDATNGYSTFSLSYEGEFGDQIERHSLNAAVRFRF